MNNTQIKERLATEIMHWKKIRYTNADKTLVNLPYWKPLGALEDDICNLISIEWNPLEKWEDTMMLVEKLREKYCVTVDLVRHGADEKNTYCRVYTTEFYKRPKENKCPACKYVNPLCIGKDKDPKMAICMAALATLPTEG